MILRLEGIARHRAGHPHAGQDLVGQRPDVLERACRVDQLGEDAALAATIGMQDLDRATRDPLDRMQDDEAGPVGDKVADRPRARLEGKLAVRSSLDPRPIAKLLARILADRLVADLEVVRPLADLEVQDRRVVGAPFLVADDERDRPNRLLIADPDGAEVAAIQFARERSGPQPLARHHLLLGPEQHDRARWGRRHDGSPWFSPRCRL